ncbi:MAG: hypothetical protein ACNYWU_07710 [Desulfobacterales bacterium]
MRSCEEKKKSPPQRKRNKAACPFADDIAFEYELLRSQVLADDRVLSPKSAGMFIVQGIIGWSKMHDKYRWTRSIVVDELVDLSSRLPFGMHSEITSILASMTLSHLKESNL